MGHGLYAASYLSASDKRVRFGLGTDQAVPLVEITWRYGQVQKIEDVKGPGSYDSGTEVKLCHSGCRRRAENSVLPIGRQGSTSLDLEFRPH
jgi:hypothetical protein